MHIDTASPCLQSGAKKHLALTWMGLTIAREVQLFEGYQLITEPASVLSMVILMDIMIMLTGAELKLPDGYQCHVVKKQQPQPQQQPQSGSSAQVPWTSTAQAASITHWKHDLLPSKTDDLPRCCEWLMLSEQVRRHVCCAVHKSFPTAGWLHVATQMQLPVVSAQVHHQRSSLRRLVPPLVSALECACMLQLELRSCSGNI